MPILLVVGGVTFVYSTLEAMLAPALPLIRAGVGGTPSSIAWVFTGLLLSGAVCTPLIGRLGDLHDKKKLFLAVLSIVTLGTALAGLATNVPVLAVGQMMQGAGLGLTPLSIGLMREALPEDRVKNGNAMIIGTSSLGVLAGPLLAGPLTSVLSYRWLFWLPFFLLVALIGLAFAVLPESPATAFATPRGRVDWLGAGLLGGGLLTLLLGLTFAPTWGWASGGFLATALGAAVLLTAFVVTQRRLASPLIDLRERGRTVFVVCAVSFAVGWAVFATYTALPTITSAPATTGYGLALDTTVTGWILVPSGVLAGLSAFAVRPLERLVGTKALMVGSCVPILAAPGVLLLDRPSLGLLITSSALMGLGIGLGLTQAMNIVVTSVPASRAASLTGLMFVVRAVGGSLGAQIGGSTLAGDVIPSTTFPTWSAFTTMLTVSAVVGLFAVLVAAALPRGSAAVPELAEVRASV
ncbi:MFS transporter [Streptomyces sp. ML-6]|uniref:MFS transporter n=1 Tax=Streptomyces sp. ML-6 TaxID=2982693 RepID=UPI0024BF9863|nr:MFS transporter [Streptomyces sp. ML-6]MDK0524166.1 MFS transporter [Streptomyces sp. ML-6]